MSAGWAEKRCGGACAVGGVRHLPALPESLAQRGGELPRGLRIRTLIDLRITYWNKGPRSEPREVHCLDPRPAPTSGYPKKSVTGERKR